MEHEELYLGWSCIAVGVPTDAATSLRVVVGVVGRTAHFRGSSLLAAARAAAAEVAADWSG